MLALIFAASFFGFLEPSAAFILGLLQIAVWPAYLIGAMLLLRTGDTVGGNTFFYFATFFGIAPGMITVGTYFAEIYGWPFDPTILGIIWLCVGLTLTFSLPGFAKGPSLTLLVISCAAIGIDFIGLGYLNVLPAVTANCIAGCFLTVTGIGGLYSAIAGILEGANIKLPLGKPLFK